MKKLLFFAIVTIVITHTHTAHAYTYQRPAGTQFNTGIDFGAITVALDQNDLVAGGIAINTWSYLCVQAQSDTNTAFSDVMSNQGSDVFSGMPTIYAIPDGNYETVSFRFSDNANCLGSNAFLTVEGGINTTIFTIGNPPVPPSNATWGSPNGFWGETTPAVMIDDMSASVQDTGANVWPLFAFVGIPVGFAIAGYLIFMIKMQLTPTVAEYNDRKRRYGNRKNKEPIL